MFTNEDLIAVHAIAPGSAGEGAPEHRSERTPRCVNEERTAQRTPAQPGAALLDREDGACF